jgi:putative hydrolase of the HAD superfamily
MEHPQVIFLDAVGTLFGVRGSVGEIYSAIASQMGVTAAPEPLNRAFIQSFKAAPPLAFPDADPAQIPDLEYQWWEAIAQETFKQAGIFEQFSDFSVFFEQLYHHFATAAPWYVYPDVLTALQRWRDREIELGIISNFDTRIYQVLEALGLRDFFASITLSSSVGAAKPQPQIFAAALEKHGCPRHRAWHIGDSLQEDFQGAKAAGIRAFWLQRF